MFHIFRTFRITVACPPRSGESILRQDIAQFDGRGFISFCFHVSCVVIPKRAQTLKRMNPFSGVFYIISAI